MPEKQKIDETVDEKIDERIEGAQLPQRANRDTAHALAATTTAAEQATAYGQRRVNLIWETTQAAIAVMITAATIYAVMNDKSSTILGNAFTLIIALYFVRTNHVKIGGIGGTDSR